MSYGLELTRASIEAIRLDCFYLVKALNDNDHTSVESAATAIADIVSRASTLSTNITNVGAGNYGNNLT